MLLRTFNILIVIFILTTDNCQLTTKTLKEFSQ